MTKGRGSRVWKVVGVPTGLAVAFVGLMGLGHTSLGRPLMPLVALIEHHGSGACPFGYGAKATPEQRERARDVFAASHRGEEVAMARPALGFSLDRTTKADVYAWASASGVSCSEPRGGHDLECSNIPDSVVPAMLRGASIQSLSLDFGEGQRLLSLTVIRHDGSAAAVSAAFQAVSRNLTSEAGAPSAVAGDPSAEWLSAGALRQASAEFRFKNYYAVARATNMGGHGYLLTEVYRSLGA